MFRVNSRVTLGLKLGFGAFKSKRTLIKALRPREISRLILMLDII